MIDRLLSPVAGDEELVVKARALTLLTLVMALVTVFYALLTALIAPEELSLVVVAALALAVTVSLGCYWLSRRGRVQLAGYIFFVGLFAAISFYMTASTTTLSDLTMAPFLYILVVLPAGYILHPRVSFIAATLATLYVIGLLLLAPPAAYTASDSISNYWSNVTMAFALFYILSAVAWIFSEGINRGLVQARQQNRELLSATEELERQQALQAEIGQQVLALAERLAQYSSRQARGSSRQADAITQVSVAIEELEHSAREIAHNAGSVDQAARQTLKQAQEGQDITWMNNEAMAVLHVKALEGAQDAGALDELLTQINSVATIMSDIASQIQLVAFNATLEAAEAGEVGRRFSVVAAEVKDLATDSLKQAKRVADIIREVQDVGASVVAASGEQVRAVETGTALTSRSNAANQAIIQSATQMAEQAAQIQESTTQQQRASEQVVTSIQEIKSVVDRWVVSSYQMDDMVANLRALAGQLA
jgi:methyl-accepting chemotaxis protein